MEKWAKRHSGEGPMPYWEWQAEECWLEKVDASKFCRVMEGRKGLLFVGESCSTAVGVPFCDEAGFANIMRGDLCIRINIAVPTFIKIVMTQKSPTQ